MRHTIVVLLLAGLLAGPIAADPPTGAAQADPKAQSQIDTAKRVYGPQVPKSSCAKEDPDEIVVCLERVFDQRVETSPPDPNTLEGRRALNGGIPRAPQFDHGYCPKCPHFGWVPPPVYYVDVRALPPAPAGSDAEKIAKGEIRGD